MSDIEYQPVQGADPVETQRHIPPLYPSEDEDDDGVHDRSSRSAAYEAISRGHGVGTLEKMPHSVDTAALETAGSSPRPTLQTRYSTIARPGQKKLGHNYRPLKQLRKLAQRLIARWLLNFLLCALMVVLFKFYEREDILTQFEKRIFNGLFLGLSLFISMNMVVCDVVWRDGSDDGPISEMLMCWAERTEIDGRYDEMEHFGAGEMDRTRGEPPPCPWHLAAASRRLMCVHRWICSSTFRAIRRQSNCSGCGRGSLGGYSS